MPRPAWQPSARRACSARPWLSSRWWATCMAVARSLDAGREDAGLVAQHGHHPGLVVGGDGGHAVAEAAGHAARVVDEAVHRVAVRPAALLLQRLGQVPVVQRQVGLDAARQQAVDQALVEVQALGVPGARAVGLHARPRRPRSGRHRRPGSRDEVQVLCPAVVVVAGDVAVAAVGDGAGHGGRSCPRSTALARRPRPHLRSGTRWWPRPRRSRAGKRGRGGKARWRSWRKQGRRTGGRLPSQRHPGEVMKALS